VQGKAKEIEAIEAEKAKDRQIRKPKSVVEKIPPQNKGKTRKKETNTIVAKKIGLGSAIVINRA
jgi:hypothetical protein